MIKRNYFISLERPYKDGSGSYSYDSRIFTCSSLLPHSAAALLIAKKEMELSMMGSGNAQILAFNRI